MTVSFVGQGSTGEDATLADAQAWAMAYEQQGLVVHGNVPEVLYPFGTDPVSIMFPAILLIRPGMEVVKLGEPTIEEIESVLPGVAP